MDETQSPRKEFVHINMHLQYDAVATYRGGEAGRDGDGGRGRHPDKAPQVSVYLVTVT